MNKINNTPVRQSNIELLRLIAMLLIIVGHTPLLSLLSKQPITDTPLTSFLTFGFKGLTICSVDVFVLISGWFGIRYKGERLLSLLFQTLFFSIIVYTTLALWKPLQYLNLDALSTIIMFHSDDYWFIKAYIGLYLFAPMLNKYIEAATEKQLRIFLIIFYTFQTIYGWLNLYGAHWFEGGFSMVSFCGLYILARYVRLYFKEERKYFWLTLYMSAGLLIGLMCFVLALMDLNIYGRLLTYTNPLVVCEALFVLLFFQNLNFKSKYINYLAASCLAMYLLHAHPLVLWPIFRATINNWLSSLPINISLIYSSLFIIAFILAAIIIDIIRKKIWNIATKSFITNKCSS